MSAILPRNYATPTFLGYPVQCDTNRIKLYFHWQILMAKLLALLCHKITSNSSSLFAFTTLGGAAQNRTNRICVALSKDAGSIRGGVIAW
jgi:hypothetical protein